LKKTLFLLKLFCNSSMIFWIWLTAVNVLAATEKLRSENWQLFVSSADADFFISDEVMTNSESDFYCHRNEATLAQFYTEQEFNIVASKNTKKLWIQGRRACQDNVSFTCGSGDMRNLYVYEDGTEVGVHADWASGEPTFGNESSLVLSVDKLHDFPATDKFAALCRREWKPLVPVGQVDRRRSSGTVIRSQDMIGLKANCRSGNAWLSNYCTVNCGKRSHIQGCPGSRFNHNEGNRCSGERMWIVAEGKARGEAINFGDVVGLYYGAGHWLSCEGKGKQCRTRSCPSSRTRGKDYRGWRWPSRCSLEKFQIQSSRWRRYRGVVRDWDQVSIVRLGTRNGWISRDNNKITLRTCPGNDGRGWLTHNCACERWNIDKI